MRKMYLQICKFLSTRAGKWVFLCYSTWDLSLATGKNKVVPDKGAGNRKFRGGTYSDFHSALICPYIGNRWGEFHKSYPSRLPEFSMVTMDGYSKA